MCHLWEEEKRNGLLPFSYDVPDEIVPFGGGGGGEGGRNFLGPICESLNENGVA